MLLERAGRQLTKPICYWREQVGNGRQLVVSNQSGRANLIVRIGEMGLNLELKDPRLGQVCRLH